MITIAVGFFTLAMFVLYLAFIPPETVQRLPRSAKRMAAKVVRVLRQGPGIRNRSGDTETTERGEVVAKNSTFW